jgi:pimeloyl-ACP methyl ester carboxylesterase
MKKLSMIGLGLAASVLSATAWAQSGGTTQTPTKPPTQPQPQTQTQTPGAGMPTIVLVHGAFADGSSWDKVVPILQAKGYHVVAVHQPLSSLADDVAATKRVIHQQPGDVILVGHSYGGVVISEAGNEQKVKGLVYVAAFAPDANESIMDLGKGGPEPAWLPMVKFDEGGFGYLPEKTVLEDFAQDVPRTEARVITAKQGWTNKRTLEDKVTTAAWHNKPSWYVRAANDRFIDPGAEAMMAKRMNAKTTSVQAGHLAMLVKPREVAAVILQAAGAGEKTQQKNI